MSEHTLPEKADNAPWDQAIALLRSKMAMFPTSLQHELKIPRDIIGQLEKLREQFSSRPQITPLVNDKRPFVEKSDAEIQEELLEVSARLLAAKARAASVATISENAELLQALAGGFMSGLFARNQTQQHERVGSHDGNQGSGVIEPSSAISSKFLSKPNVSRTPKKPPLPTNNHSQKPPSGVKFAASNVLNPSLHSTQYYKPKFMSPTAGYLPTSVSLSFLHLFVHLRAQRRTQ